MESGKNIVMQPISHTVIELGPAAAATATHCKFEPATTKNSATSARPRERRSCGSWEPMRLALLLVVVRFEGHRSSVEPNLVGREQAFEIVEAHDVDRKHVVGPLHKEIARVHRVEKR